MQKQSRFIEAEEKSLKAVYPELEKRKSYAQVKLKGCILKNPFLIRVEPIQKYFKQTEKIKFLTLITEGSTPMRQVNAHIHKKLKLSPRTALFLTSGSDLVCLNKTVLQMTEKGLEQDGILYIGYADQDPFG